MRYRPSRIRHYAVLLTIVGWINVAAWAIGGAVVGAAIGATSAGLSSADPNPVMPAMTILFGTFGLLAGAAVGLLGALVYFWLAALSMGFIEIEAHLRESLAIQRRMVPPSNAERHGSPTPPPASDPGPDSALPDPRQEALPRDPATRTGFSPTILLGSILGGAIGLLLLVAADSPPGGLGGSMAIVAGGLAGGAALGALLSAVLPEN